MLLMARGEGGRCHHVCIRVLYLATAALPIVSNPILDRLAGWLAGWTS